MVVRGGECKDYFLASWINSVDKWGEGSIPCPPPRIAWGLMQGWIEKFSCERVNKTASLSFTLQYTFPPPPSFPSPPSHSFSFPKLTPHPFSLDTRPHYYPSWIVRAQTFAKMFIIKQRSKYLNKCFQEVSLCRLYGWNYLVTLVGGGDFNVGGFLCLRDDKSLSSFPKMLFIIKFHRVVFHFFPL